MELTGPVLKTLRMEIDCARLLVLPERSVMASMLETTWSALICAYAAVARTARVENLKNCILLS